MRNLCHLRCRIHGVAVWFKVRTRSTSERHLHNRFTRAHRSGTYAKTLSCPCLPPHTSLHTLPVAVREVSGEMQLPLGINKCANHTSPEDICKHLYLWAAVGIFIKDCWDKETIPGSILSITTQTELCSCFPLFLLM